MSTSSYNVRLGNKIIDIISYDDSMTVEEVKQSLINHDGYDPAIIVTKRRKVTPKKLLAPSQQECYSPIPAYDPKEDGDYSDWLVFHNID